MASRFGRFLAATAAGALGALAGCSATTYGTGTSPGMQTLQDIVGLAALSNEKKEPIQYRPRPPVVAPPSVEALPTPGSETATVAVNWPKDPDELAKQVKLDSAAREAAGKEPNFRLPPTPPPQQTGDQPLTPEQVEQVKKLYAQAKSTLAVDENGIPIRRYLTEPPVEYRAPDPDSPVDITEDPKKKKKKKWWQVFGSRE
ncbi:MAG: hypothetical protein WD036_09585 [Bauldia sp.]